MNVDLTCGRCSITLSRRTSQGWKDGLSCPECRGPLFPTSRVINTEDRNAIKMKLEYLAELRMAMDAAPVIRTDIARRMQMVCDSLEKNLGLSNGSDHG